MEHVMIDLETLDTSNNAVILSIAAVPFNIDDGMTGDHFKINIQIDSAMKAGLSVNGATLQWWLSQRPEIMRLMFEDPRELHFALNHLSMFFKNKKLTYIWGNSARFDLGILENAYRKMGIIVPWNYRNERCYRTMINMLPLPDTAWNAMGENTIQQHDPLYDCYKQIKVLTAVWKTMKPVMV